MPLRKNPFSPWKLEPLRFRSLADTRAVHESSRADFAVHVPNNDKYCWAEIRPPGSWGYFIEFRGCGRQHRDGYLTCLVHYNREMVARELKCEKDGVAMDDIAYADEAAREAHEAMVRADYAARRAARKQGV
jgi:hypothetical protein